MRPAPDGPARPRRRSRPRPSSAVLTPSSRFTAILGYGTAALPFVGAAVPFAFPTSRSAEVVAALLMSIGLLGLWLARLVWVGRLVFVRSVLYAPVCAFMLAWVFAMLSSNAFLDPRVAFGLAFNFTTVQIAAVTVAIVSLGLLLLGINIPPRRRFVQVATWSMVAVGAVWITAEYTHLTDYIWFMSTSGLFTMWLVAIAYGQALFNQELRPVERGALLVLVGAIMFRMAILDTVWLSGWVPGAVAMGLITVRRSWKLAFVCGVVFLLFAAVFSHQMYEAIYQTQVDEGSDSRFDIWMQAWDLLSQHPVFGTGPVGYAAYYMTLYAGSDNSLSTHSNWLDIAAETGIVGFATFLWTGASLLWVIGKGAFRWQRGLYGGFANAALGGLAGATIAMALGDWVIPFIYNQGIEGFRYTLHTWVYLGLAAGLTEASLKTRDGQAVDG